MLRIIVREEDCTNIVHGGCSHPQIETKTFDVELPEVEAYLREKPSQYNYRSVLGVEVRASAGERADALEVISRHLCPYPDGRNFYCNCGWKTDAQLPSERYGAYKEHLRALLGEARAVIEGEPSCPKCGNPPGGPRGYGEERHSMYCPACGYTGGGRD